MKKIIILCVNYNSYDCLEKYLESVDYAYGKAMDMINLHVVVSDNSIEKKEINRNMSYRLDVFYTGLNCGYFGGIEYGIHNCNVRLSEFDFIIISNVDVQVAEDFFLILSAIKEPKSIGCIAPSIYSMHEKRDRNPKILIRPSKKKLVLQRMMYKYSVLEMLYRWLLYSKRRKRIQNFPSGKIYAAHGSFIIFTNRFADFLQSMDYPCFLFGEEIYLAENLRARGLETNYEPVLKVFDSDHVSTSKMKSKMYYKYNYESIDMLLKEFFNE